MCIYKYGWSGWKEDEKKKVFEKRGKEANGLKRGTDDDDHEKR